MASRRTPLRRSFVMVTASVVVAGLGCGGSVDGAAADGGPLSTSCPVDKPVEGTPCAVDSATFCTATCEIGRPYWVVQCTGGQWKDGAGSCNPPRPDYDAGPDTHADALPDVVGESSNPPPPDAIPDVPTTCPDAIPVEGTYCAVDPAAYCGPPCDAAHAGASYWVAQCVDHHWHYPPVATCNPPAPPPDTGVDAADASDAG